MPVATVPVVHVLFAYGTLQHPPLLERLLGRRPPTRPAVLRGWRAARLRARAYPGLVACDRATTRGVVIEVDDRELAVLDAFEGSLYRRAKVRPRVAGDPVEAEAWVLLPGGPELVLDEDWSLERFLAHDAEGFVAGSVAGRHHPGGTP